MARAPTCCWPNSWPRGPTLAGEVFNFSYERRMTVLELVDRLLAVMGSTLEPDVRNEASNEIRDQYLDASKARAMLGWSPAFTLDAGLRATVDWYKEYFRRDARWTRRAIPVVILCGGAGHAAGRADRGAAEAARRDRRPADPVAHHEALLAVRLQRVRAGARATRAIRSSATSSTTTRVGQDMTISLQDGQVAPLNNNAWSRGRCTSSTPARRR